METWDITFENSQKLIFSFIRVLNYFSIVNGIFRHNKYYLKRTDKTNPIYKTKIVQYYPWNNIFNEHIFSNETESHYWKG